MRSLRRFLLLGSLPVIGVVAIAAALIGYYGSRHEAEEIFDTQMAEYARLLATALPRSAADSASTRSADGNPRQPAVVPDGALEYGHEYERRLTFQYWVGDRQVTRSRYAPALGDRVTTQGYHSITLDGQRWRVFALHLDENRRILIAEDDYVRDELGLTLATAALLPLLIAVPVIAGLLSIIINLAIRRINAVAGDVAERSPTDLTPVGSRRVPQELWDLVESVNGLLERLRAGIEREQQFSADAAHELRTPITGIRIHLQNALLATPEDSEVHQSLQQAELGVGRMTHIVEQLLQFNRAVNEEEQVGTELIDLDEVVQDVVATQQPVIEHCGQELRTRLEPARVRGNRELLAIVLGNLLANASQHAPRGAHIMVSTRRDGATIHMDVEDSGPGMPAAKREQAPARFHRGAASQTGCGLGLAIALRICERHGAGLSLEESSMLGGLRATVSFPAAD